MDVVTCEWRTADGSDACDKRASTGVVITPPNRPVSRLALCARHAESVSGGISSECTRWTSLEEHLVRSVLES